ncbi:Metallophosphoesterase 1 homolog [Gryllus bimaculatus]|nr:Metallophosphoesterase 1 homolog [Gryllus bimaculatus]
MPAIHRSKTKIVLLFLGTLIFYNEFLSYFLQSIFKWPAVSCDGRPECVKILLVADPQIIGEQFEPGFPLGTLARWDCDRYLSKTFHHVVSHVNPDVVAFLGDIMDEGSIASKEEYIRYSRRFFNIFQTNVLMQYIYLPGDNDIGGEDDDRLTNDKLKRYDKTFSQAESFRIKSVDIYKVNRLTFSMPRNLTATGGNRTNIVLTHLPLLFLPNQFVHKVVKQLRPQIIFSAHDHKSLHTSIETDLKRYEQFVEMLLPSGGPMWQFQLSKTVIHEIMVPTCSYRMGVADVGYGVALIDNSGSMTYTVLWLPSRFSQLGAYVGMFLVFIFYWSSYTFCCICSHIRRKMAVSKHIV